MEQWPNAAEAQWRNGAMAAQKASFHCKASPVMQLKYQQASSSSPACCLPPNWDPKRAPNFSFQAELLSAKFSLALQEHTLPKLPP